jgi:hypothetical protein
VPYELGQVVPLSFSATDVNGAPANAAACTVTIKRPWPDGSTDGPFTVAPGQPGQYVYPYQTVVAGRHTYRWAATGTPGPGVGVGAQPDVFDVVPATANGIISLADAKDMLNIPAASTAYDAKLRQYIRSITGFVERYCGPVIVQQVTEREYGGGMEIVLRKPPVIEAPMQLTQITAMTPVLTYGLTYDLSQLTVDFSTGIVRHNAGLPFIYGPYDMSYWAGRPVIPDEIMLGSESILKHQWEQERGGAGRSGGYGGDDVTVMWGFAIPNRALEMLEPQRAPGGIA